MTRVLLTRKHSQLQRWTKSVLNLVARAGRLDVGARVEIGRLLLEVRENLEHGEWLGWVDEEVPFSNRSAELYVHLYRWANEHPGSFERAAPLGLSKLYLLLRLDPTELRRLLRRKKHPIPGTDKVRTLELMTAGELLAVVRELRGLLAGGVPLDRLMSSYQRRVHGLTKATDALVEHAAELPPEFVEALREELLEAAERLAEL